MKKVLSIPGQMLISGVMSGIAMEVVAFLAGKREDGFHAAPLATSQIHKMSMKTTLPLTLILLASAWGALAQAPVLDDAQIAAVVIDANLIDIEAGKLAQFKSTDPEVQFFAQRMVTDHAVARDSATELTTRLKLIPQENSITRDLKANGKENLEKLKPLRRAAFDKAYIDHEVAYHVQVLGIIDQTLIPGAKDERLKHLLAKNRPPFISHHEHAQRMQESVHQKNP
jgi:putative membrane protein